MSSNTTALKSICVFCGSSEGNSPQYMEQAKNLGEKLATEGITLVYGGAKVGLMGGIADASLSQGGKVIGILPTFLQAKEIAHPHLSELILVESMHERKTRMNELCDGVIALPGGFGTLEELFEMLTWGQLGLHQKPIGILNIDHYYDDLVHLLENMVQNGFLKTINRDMLLVSNNIDDLLQQMKNYQSPNVDKLHPQ